MRLLILSKSSEENIRPSFDLKNIPKIKDSFKELIEKCWSKNPEERPTFEEIFRKLAYNKEVDDDNDDEEKKENNYYLDNIDIDKVLSYVYSIDTGYQDITVETINKLIEIQINPLKVENKELNNQIEELNKKIKDNKPLMQGNNENEKLNESIQEIQNHFLDVVTQLKHEMNNKIEAIQINNQNMINELRQKNEILEKEKNEMAIKFHEKLKN